MRLSTAPVNEPFSWPNRMLSTRFSGMAPQLTVTNGLPARSLSPWMARAISSLPTPLSPSISTGMLEAAARLPSAITRCMPSPRMMRSSKVSVPSTFFLMRLISPASASIFMALLIDTSSRSGEAGLMTKSTAPSAHGVDRGIDRAVRGLHDDGRKARLALELLEHGHAVDAGHDEIEQHEGDVGALGTFEHLEGLLAGVRGLGFKAEALDGLFENAALGRIVVDD